MHYVYAYDKGYCEYEFREFPSEREALDYIADNNLEHVRLIDGRELTIVPVEVVTKYKVKR